MVSYLIHVPLLATLISFLYRKSAGLPLANLFFFALAGKLLAGVALGLLYIYYYPYGGDTFTFFADAKILSKLAVTSQRAYSQVLLFNHFPDSYLTDALVYEWEPRSFFFIKILSVLNVFTLNNYWISGLYCSLFSFWGMWSLANTLTRLFPSGKWAAALGFLFFPSVVFWCAGVMKESVAMGAIGWVTATWLPYLLESKWANPGKWLWQLTGSLLLLVVLWQLKYYYCVVYLACVVSCWLAILLVRKWEIKSRWAMATGWLLLFAGMAGIGSQLHANLRIDNLLKVLTLNHHLLLSFTAPENQIRFDHLQPNFASMLQNLPLALVSGLFRPFAWERDNGLQLLAGLENTVLLAMAAVAVFQLFRISKIPFSSVTFLLLLATGLYILLLAALLSFSTPNFGTLARYKVGFMPFLVYLIAIGMRNISRKGRKEDTKKIS